MRFCAYHWDTLRAKITERGMGDLIAPDGTVAVEQEIDQLRRGGEHTAVNYDPLMAAHWAVTNNALETLGQANPGAVFYLLADGDKAPEDPIEPPDEADEQARATAQRVGTWPRCPVGYLGIAHELTCREGKCKLPRVDGYAWMLDRAANDALAKAKSLRLVK